MRKLLGFLIVLVASSCILGCGGDNNRIGYGTGELLTIYVPFIEKVEFPENIYAGEMFEIKVSLSAEMKPEVLNGRSESDGITRLSFPFDSPPPLGVDPLVPVDSNGLPIFDLPPEWDWPLVAKGNALFFDRENFSGEPKIEYIASGVIYAPGEFVLRLSGAKSRKFGGYRDSMHFDDPGVPGNENLEHFDFPFTVLPAPDDAE